MADRDSDGIHRGLCHHIAVMDYFRSDRTRAPLIVDLSGSLPVDGEKDTPLGRSDDPGLLGCAVATEKAVTNPPGDEPDAQQQAVINDGVTVEYDAAASLFDDPYMARPARCRR